MGRKQPHVVVLNGAAYFYPRLASIRFRNKVTVGITVDPFGTPYYKSRGPSFGCETLRLRVEENGSFRNASLTVNDTLFCHSKWGCLNLSASRLDIFPEVHCSQQPLDEKQKERK